MQVSALKVRSNSDIMTMVVRPRPREESSGEITKVPGAFLSFGIWTLYPSSQGQATPATLGHLQVAATLDHESLYD